MGRRQIYARLHVDIASEARKAVILRRGPTRQVQMLLWHLDKDRIEPGQWFKGRVYEHNCEVSRSGKLFSYHASVHHKWGKVAVTEWSAISKPPYFTALYFQPMNCYGAHEVPDGFQHIPDKVIEREFELDQNYREDRFWGRDRSLYRGGWVLIDKGEKSKPTWDEPVGWRMLRPRIYEKKAYVGWYLQMRMRGMFVKNGPRYWLDYAVIDRHGQEKLFLGRIDWADWDQKDLLFAKEGKLYRLPSKHIGDYGQDKSYAKLIADLNGNKFEKISPKNAHWP